MAKKRASKRLAKESTRIVGRLPDEKRAELAKVIQQIESEQDARIKKPSLGRVALAKLKGARMREGLSLADVSRKAGVERGNISRLENNVENVELSTLVRLADALGYDLVVDLKKRDLRAIP